MEAILLVAVFTACFLVRLWPLRQSLFWDEAVYLQNAEVICCAKINYSELNSRPPLLSLLFAAVFMLWHNVYVAGILTAALNALSPIFLYLVGRRSMGRGAAAIAALLLAFLPFFVDAGNSLLTDSPALTLILICFWMLVKGSDENRQTWFVFAGLMAALAVLMRFASLPTIAVLSVLCLRRKRFAHVCNFAAGFAVGFTPYLLWSRIRYGAFLATLRQGWVNVVGDVEPRSYYLHNFATVFSWVTVVGLILWLVVNAFRPWQRTEPHEHGIYGTERRGGFSGWDLFLAGWGVAVLAYFTTIAHKELRYILPLAPPLLLLAASGFAQLLRFRNSTVRAVAAAALIVPLGYSFAPTFGRFRSPLQSPYVSEERQVSDYLNRVAPKTAIVYANFNYPVIAYYTRLTIHVLPEEADAFYNEFPQNMPDDGYLVLYRESDKDPSVAWADSDPHFRCLEEFSSLIIYEYRAKAH